MESKIIILNNHEISLSNLDKLYWPAEKITKGDVINYYDAIASFILPYLKNRPMVLKRNPNGIRDEGFYQKDASPIAPIWMKTANIYSTPTKKTIQYLVCDNKASLLYIANLGCIEMHPWHSRLQEINKPDYIVIDIDPSVKNTFDDVVEVAIEIKSTLDKLAIKSYCKTSGATGLHIYIPCSTKYTYSEIRNFAHQLAILVNKRLPHLTTLERSLNKRKTNQIYIDYLQNKKGQTLSSAYSVRARPGATVSTPLEWEEVKIGLDPKSFTIHTIIERLRRKGDLFKSVLHKSNFKLEHFNI